jgi:sulfur-oxidizing protein SoxY
MAMKTPASNDKLFSSKRRAGIVWAASSCILSTHFTATATALSELPSEGIALDFPRLADTGNAIPLQANIQAPQGAYLTSLRVILPENPNPLALRLKLQGQLQSYQLNTRLRLSASQSVWVVASFSNGMERANSAPTVITSTACLDDS